MLISAPELPLINDKTNHIITLILNSDLRLKEALYWALGHR